MEGRRGSEAHGDTAGLAACGATGPHGSLVDSREDRFGIDQKGAAGIGQADAARMAHEERRVDLAFEGAYLLRQRRLLDVEFLGRTRDMPLMGNGDEVAEMAQFHCIYREYGYATYHIFES